MRLGIIGRGRWGDVYAETLGGMGIEYWQSGKDWKGDADGIIIACAPEAHFNVAKHCIQGGIPVVIEKPMCMSSAEAETLVTLAKHMDAIALTSHTHLYSPAWSRFRQQALQEGVKRIESQCGGPCKLSPLWDWGPHDVAMCIDLLGRPQTQKFEDGVLTLTWRGGKTARITINKEKTQRKFSVNGHIHYTAPMTNPTPLQVLITQFVTAIRKDVADIKGVLLGAQVIGVIDGS